MYISAIIPTYNRPDSVLRALQSLAKQTLAPDAFEVIVVDDGSTYDPAEITNHDFPFTFQYIRQENQGATVARNRGVQQSRGRVLVFMDDDVTASPTALAALADTCTRHAQTLAMGTLISRSEDESSPYTQDAIAIANQHLSSDAGHADDEYMHFTQCNTQLLAVKREDFLALDMLQDPTGGWPNWDDVDFGYRAHLAGFQLMRSGRAVGIHWDYSLSSLESACRRWQRASKSAVRLFQVHPQLQPHIPMFRDKTPIDWGGDPPRLIVRKLARRGISAPPIIRGMERIVRVAERVCPAPRLLRPLYRWISGAYMLYGYREGIREYGAERTPIMEIRQ